MKLKELDKNQQLVGLKIKIPKAMQLEQGLKKEMFIYSGWNRGLWLKKEMTDERVYPFTFEKFKDIENYEVKGMIWPKNKE